MADVPGTPAATMLDRLDALHAKATPGPWTLREHLRAWSIDAGMGGPWITTTMPIGDNGRENAEVIVALVNAWPKLSRVLKAAQRWSDSYEADGDWVDEAIADLRLAVRALSDD